MILAAVLLAIYLGIAVAVAIWLMVLKAMHKDSKWAPTIIGISISVQIKIMNKFYQIIAKKLTDWENWRTTNEYESALYFKIFSFQFVNSFISLFYLAHIQPFVSGCNKERYKDSCTEELFQQLLILFGMFIFFNTLEIGIPLLKKKLAQSKHKQKSSLYVQSKMESDNIQADYMEIMICFGYITLYAQAFPLSAIFGFFAIIIEIKVDCYINCRLNQRSYPDGASGIGIWQGILEFLVVCMICTNCWLIFITEQYQDIKDKSSDYSQVGFLIFICVSYGILVIMHTIRETIPDIKLDTRDLQKRHDFIIESKYFEIESAD